ncbi:choice-of-anchor I family protein [Brevibacterium ihuae]|uniref:choice-of-anchor I family protein n=1 Tax=Brevibacterium ihuae TaxID=1631743 RepID=UPI000C78CD72|nr:choice-of-anchor I family protein [Brevibacterium ihuae]
MRRALTSGGLVAALVGLGALAPAVTVQAASPRADGAIEYSSANPVLTLDPVGTHRTGLFDESAAEIVAHYAAQQQTLVVNAAAGTVNVLDSSDPADPRALFELETVGMESADGSTVEAGGIANSVAVREDGLAAVAVEHPTKTEAGWIAFFDLSGEEPAPLGAVRTGALPDSVVLSPAGDYAVVANEGEPAEDYSVDPEGSVGVIALPDALEAPGQDAVRLAGFRAFEGDALPDGVRIFGGREDAGTGTPEFPVSENLEPEYGTVIGDRAYVSLQEANAIAVVDLASASVERLLPLGTQDLSAVDTDVSDRDGGIGFDTWPVQTFMMPDTLKSVSIGGSDYLLTANEGDSRDWDGYSEEIRVKDFGTDGVAPLCESVAAEAGMSIEELQRDEDLGRLKATAANGLSADGSCYEQIHGFGGRSFSILDTEGNVVFDSRDEFEKITAEAVPDFFNSDNTESSFDDRSDDKGPEPEAIEVGSIGEKTFAFIGLERVGGVMVYDITRPDDAEFVTYFNNRNFGVEDLGADLDAAGDSGPESIVFVPAAQMETPAEGVAGMLVIGNEVTGTTTFYHVKSDLAEDRPGDDPSAPGTEQPSTGPTPTDDPAPTGSPTDGAEPTATPTSTQAPAPGPDGGSDDDSDDRAGGGPLPRTGTDAAILAGIGALLAAIGAAAVWLTRRARS